MKQISLFIIAGGTLFLSACTQPPSEVVYKGDNFYGRNGSEVVFSPTAPVLFSQDSAKYKAEQFVEPASISNVGVKELAPIKVNSVEPPNMAQSQPFRVSSAPFVAPQTVSPPAPVVSAPVAVIPVAAAAQAPAITPVAVAAPIESHKPLPALVAAVPAQTPEKAALENRISVNLFPGKAAAPQVASNSMTRFIWPVQGKVVSKFGSRSHGQLNDGINIAADEGEPIWAAAGGTVVYAGSQIKGYGNMVIVRHPEGWVTTYAHASKLAVSKDDTVKQGQIIAYVGATGSVQSAQLHFGIRDGVEPVNPERFLSRDVAALN